MNEQPKGEASNKEVGLFIQAMRLRLQIPQREFAQRVNKEAGDGKVSDSTVSDWENGRQRPIKYASAIARVLNISVDELWQAQENASGGHEVDTTTLDHLFTDTDLSALSDKGRYYLAGLLKVENVEEHQARAIMALLSTGKLSQQTAMRPAPKPKRRA